MNTNEKIGKWRRLGHRIPLLVETSVKDIVMTLKD
jgi:hypothetical protein